MYRRIWMIILAALLLSLLVACGNTTTSQPAADATAPSAPTNALPAATTSTAAESAATSTSGQSADPAAATTAPEPAASAPSAAAQPAAGMRTFQIVPDQTEASYEVQEQFLDRNLPSQAIGKTNSVDGQFQFTANGKPTGQITKISVDLRTLKSDSGMRDRRIKTQWLESEKYPFAEFVSTGVEGVPDSYTEGQEITFKLNGNLTIHDVTKPVTFDVTGKLAGDTVTGTATTLIMMKDFGFDPPNVAGILTVKDGVTLKINFTAKESA